jgi:ATP-binding cassette, subfamily C, type I secretion system permease/ATPase
MADGSVVIQDLRRKLATDHGAAASDRLGGPPQPAAIAPVQPHEVRGIIARVLLAAAAVSGGINLLQLAPAIYMYQVYDRVLATQHVETLVALTIVAGLALILLAALDGARNAVGQRLGAWVERSLAGPLLHATVHGAPLVGTAKGAQALRDLATVRGAIGQMMWPLLDAPWTPIFFAVAFLIHPLLGWIGVAGGLVLLSLAITNEVLTRRAIQRGGSAQIAAIGDADTAVRNADTLLAMGMLPAWLGAWQAQREAASRPQSAAGIRSGIIGSAAKAARLALQVAILGFGAWLVIRHELTAGAMIATSIIVARALAPFEMAIASWRGLVAAQAAWKRLAALLVAAPRTGATIRLPRPHGTLVVDKLTYLPPGGREPILKQISFAAKGGEMIAMIGPSGAGKTTLARLIVGSLAPNAGSVRLDGGAIANWAPGDRAQYVGYLPQDVELFNGTVRDNIARFTEVADEAVVAAARLAGAHEVILSLPQGYATPIGPAGLALSGGQRQRIGLARAVFGDPRLVVLDEPNSNLDPNGEAALIEAVRRLKAGGVTVICVAQRAELILQADQILRLSQGQVDAFGRRDEILGRAIRAASGGDPAQLRRPPAGGPASLSVAGAQP